MNQQDRHHLLAERKFLQERVAALPLDARIMRISTESRLRAIDAQISLAPVDESEPARVRLTFNGRPVVGSHGIFAEFAMKVVTNFTETVAAVAASLATTLAASGPLPNRGQHQLLITNTALGSFGFELEEYRAGPLPADGISAVAQALDRTQALLSGTLGSDDQLADSVADTDPRALEKLRGFLQTLVDNDAICALQYQSKSFRFTDVGQVKSSLARISQDNLHEEPQVLVGELQGVLPKSRAFEFKLAQSEVVVKGKVGASIEDVSQLNSQLNQCITVKVLMTQVGNGRPRYVLTEVLG